MSHNSVIIHNLSKSYGAVKALNDISFEIKAGSFFGLLGPNGAGKSTIINIMASLVKKDSGKVLISGVDLDQNVNLVKQKLGVVPQELLLDPFFSVEEVLNYYAGYYGIKKSERRTEELIEVMGLRDKAKAKPRSLSGGMKRRLLVAKALVHNPDVIILDEPTAGVDVELRTQLWRYMKKLNIEQGKTIILTTHYLEEAEELCDHIAVINKGKVIAIDSKDSLKKRLGYKIIKFSFNKVDDSLLSILSNYGEVKLLSASEVEIKYSTELLKYNHLMSNIVKNGYEIIDIVTEESDIEEIFKRLVLEHA